MIGYLGNARVEAITCNAVHTYVGPLVRLIPFESKPLR